MNKFLNLYFAFFLLFICSAAKSTDLNPKNHCPKYGIMLEVDPSYDGLISTDRTFLRKYSDDELKELSAKYNETILRGHEFSAYFFKSSGPNKYNGFRKIAFFEGRASVYHYDLDLKKIVYVKKPCTHIRTQLTAPSIVNLSIVKGQERGDCIGVRVGARHFLTAAHCLTGDDVISASFTINGNRYAIDSHMPKSGSITGDYTVFKSDGLIDDLENKDFLLVRVGSTADWDDFYLLANGFEDCKVVSRHFFIRRLITYSCRSWPGMSGAPLINDKNGVPAVIGLNTRGNGEVGQGIEFNQIDVDNIYEWIKENP